MRHIISSLDKFTVAIRSGEFIDCHKDGQWEKQKGWAHFFCWIKSIFVGQDGMLQKTTKVFCDTVLDQIESEGVRFSTNEETQLERRQRYENVLKAGEALRKKTKSITFCQSVREFFHPQQLATREHLKQRLVALRYRIEEANGGINPQHQRKIDDRFVELCKEMKLKEPLYSDEEKKLSVRDMKRIETALTYNKFAKLFVSEKATDDFRKKFFKWAIRNGGHVEPFVEYPATIKKLDRAFMLSDISSEMKNDDDTILNIEKRVTKKGDQKKVLTLPVEAEDNSQIPTNILKGSKEITLREGWKVTLDEAFAQMANRNLDIGDIRFYGHCLRNWNSHQLGRRRPTPDVEIEGKEISEDQIWNRIDLEASKWWEQIPTSNVISLEELRALYNIPQLQRGQWVAIVRATREEKSRTIDKSHGYIEVAIPQDSYGSSYQRQTYGGFAGRFPNGDRELLDFLANTVKGKLSCPDENITYRHRQHAAIPYILTDEQAELLMKLIQKDLIEARKGNLVFQFAGESCAYRPQKYMDTVMGEKQNLFVADISTIDIPIVGCCFKVSFAVDPIFYEWTTQFFTWALRGERGLEVIDEKGQKVAKSLKTHPLFRDERKVHLPANLFTDPRAVVWFGEEPGQRKTYGVV